MKPPKAILATLLSAYFYKCIYWEKENQISYSNLTIEYVRELKKYQGIWSRNGSFHILLDCLPKLCIRHVSDREPKTI